MGRLLDIARQTKGTLRPSATPAEASRKGHRSTIHAPLLPISIRPKPQFEAVAADVVALIAQAGWPVSHSTILKTLVGAGRDKVSVRQAIARCQKQEWIEHDLMAGYVLPNR